MKRKIRPAKAFRLPMIDFDVSIERVGRSPEWLDRVDVMRALGVNRRWSAKITRAWAARTTAYGPLVERKQLAKLLRREAAIWSRERQALLANARRIDAERERGRQESERRRNARRQRKLRRLQESQEQIRKAVERRKARWTYARIGRELGVSRQRAYQMVKEAERVLSDVGRTG